MISSLDLLYLVLAVVALLVCFAVLSLTFQLLQVLQDIRRIAQNVEQMTALLERLAQAGFPGLERLVRRADRLEQKTLSFVERKVDQLTK